STSTVKTLLRRLVDKGHLRARAVGNSFLYSTARSPMRSLKRAGDSLLEHTSEATVGPLLAHLVTRGGLSQGDLQELKELVDRLSEDSE
ncbi:MAG: BlaI/MecI/CopY family transcriptional regulator, partial [Planctomycetota bacterium]